MNRLHANHAFHGLNGLHGLSAIHAASRSAGGTHPGTRTTEHLPTRQFLHAGDEIDALRVLAVPHVLLSGVAISRRLIDAPEELQLLQPGDLVGLETFQLRAGERCIQALIDCELAPLRRMSDAEWRELLLHALLRRESRPGLASLRVGPVSEQVRRLLLLLSGAGLSERDVLELPPLASIAAVTASTNETVCRVVSHFRRSGLIEDAGSRKVRLTAGLTRSKSRVRD